MPAANSDARAASWDRNLVAQLKVYFDKDGKRSVSQPNASSSGKWWEDGIKHPEIKEYMVGTSRQLGQRWTARLYWLVTAKERTIWKIRTTPREATSRLRQESRPLRTFRISAR